ncbi:ROK family protein [Roseococcus sp. SDR]|uniref:ROK family protein n=1 Tax=Roseococcus sp. SDR TaxID=2835532 RepID=UPI001BD12833|nr:ROK family protein [Roseococcus sp. SDR]MBS7791411.1 ROK family protein [Roseococcus sp. SDR]MBV1846725.1 ROK family protein [Roseococcus sp. SDR]
MRIGIDLGGTKTEVVALGVSGEVLLRRRQPTPPDYAGVIQNIAALVQGAEAELGARGTVGVGIPGSLSPATGLVRGANSIWLNGGRLDVDLAAALGRPVRLSNDANCLALSEAADGAGAGASSVFAVILGTGVGGGLVIGGRLVEGFNRIGGEWGHNPLPWMTEAEFPGPACWCGKRGCIETFLSGPALAADADGPGARDASGLPARRDEAARAALARHTDRLARALAAVVNLVDPEVIILGGGLSNMAHLYEDLPRLLPRHVFSDVVRTRILPARHGDSSGVLGAARLWDS